MAGILPTGLPLTLPTLNPASLVSTITNAAGELTLLAGNPQLIPFAIPIITGSVSDGLTTIPIIGTPLADAQGSAIGVITQVIGPGETQLLTVVGSATAVIGTVTEVIPVIGTVTGLLGSVISTAGSLLVTPAAGSTPTGVVAPSSTPSGGIVSPSPPLGTGSSPSAKSSGVTTSPKTGASTTPRIPLFSNAAVPAYRGSAGAVATFAVLGSMVAGLMFGGAAVVLM